MVRMAEEYLYSVARTFVWDRSVLYVFKGSIRQAKRWGDIHRGTLPRSPDVADVPHQGASLVWMDNTPYLFPGSLSAASHRGKGWKGEDRKNSALALYHRRLEAAGFEKQYGAAIGKG